MSAAYFNDSGPYGTTSGVNSQVMGFLKKKSREHIYFFSIKKFPEILLGAIIFNNSKYSPE